MSTLDTPQAMHVDILVIGGGIMGLWLTWRYCLRGYHVLCLRLSDEGQPCNETLRNQGWLQSGARYFRALSLQAESLKARLAKEPLDLQEKKQMQAELDKIREQRDAAVEMYYSAREIRQELGIAVQGAEEQGTVRLRQEETWTEDLLNGHVEGKLRIPELGARPLHRQEAAKRLRHLFDPEGNYLATSERTFEEDVILAALRTRALATRRARIRVLRDCAVLGWDDARPSHAVCTLSAIARQVRANRIFVAAGAGTPCLLAGLGLPDVLTVRKTPLLVGRVPATLDNLVLEERARRFSLVVHGTTHGPVGIVGVGAENPYEPMQESLPVEQVVGGGIYEASARRVSQEIVDRAQSRVADVFLAPPRITSGYEPTVADQLEWSSWLHVPRPAGNVVVALPGRATLAPAVAAQCERFDFDGEAWPTPPQALAPPGEDFAWAPLPGSEWSDTPRMHHHACYDHMNDAKD